MPRVWGVVVASPRLRVSMALRGAVGESWWWRGRALLLLVVVVGGRRLSGVGEGLRRGLGPLPVPDQGFCVPSGAGLSLPLSVGQSGPMGGAGPAPHLSPGSALRCGQGCGVGWVGPGFPRAESHPAPASPYRPLGQFLSRKLLLQLPIICRPRGAGVGDA